MLLFLDEIESEKGASGRYNDQDKHEHIDVPSFLTILTWKKAPAAAISADKNVSFKLIE